MSKIAIIVKGNLKRASALKGELKALLPDNYTVVDKHTEHKGHATNLAKEAIEDGAKFIIAAGGDGTVNEVVNGIMNCDEDKRKSIFLGILPLGTGNDFVRTAKISNSINDLSQLIINEQYRCIDIGACRFTNRNKTKTDRYFNNIAEVGLGAKVVEIVGNSKKRFGGTMSFLKAITKAFVQFRKPYVKIRTQGINWSGRIITVCFANGQYFGSGLGIAPTAKLDDGNLSLVIVGDVKLVHFVSNLPKLRKLKPIKHKQIFYHKIKTCELTSKKSAPIEIDGENVGFTPFKVSIIPAAIRLLSKK